MTQQELDPWVEGYLGYLRDVRRTNARTIVDMRCTLKKASIFFLKGPKPRELWQISLDDYLRWLNVQRSLGRSNAAVAKELSHIRGLLDYAFRSARADRNVLDGFSLQHTLKRKLSRSLSLEEAERLVMACSKGTALDRRDRLIVLILYGCGLRTAELCQLDVGDIDVERQELFVRNGKGNRPRTIPIPGAVWVELLAYLTERSGKRGPLFRTTAKRKRISSKGVGDVVKSKADLAGIDWHVTARTLRHTFATHLMDREVPLAVIASLMGHRSPTETGVYLHALPGRREAAVASLDGKPGEER